MPSIRRARRQDGAWLRDSNEDILKYWMPLLIARRKGNALKSTFLAVHEPYERHPFIKKIYANDNTFYVETKDYTDVHLFGWLSHPEKFVKNI